MNTRLNQACSLLTHMQQDTKSIQSSLERGKSQSQAIKDLEIRLKKFVEHCRETRSYLLKAEKMET